MELIKGLVIGWRNLINEREQAHLCWCLRFLLLFVDHRGGRERKEVAERILNAYKFAQGIANAEFLPIHPIKVAGQMKSEEAASKIDEQ